MLSFTRRSILLLLAGLTLVSLAWGTFAQADEKFTTGSSDPLITYINEQIRQGWKDNEITPSDTADDAEWMRRVYLDVVGHIPSGKDVEEFLRDKDPAKRSKLVDKLLADSAYVRNFTTYWTNTLIGRVTPDKTNRAALEKFLRESLAKNRPWNDIAYDLISAEGRFDENGATNYLLAQLQLNPNSEEYVVEATARLPGFSWACRCSALSATTTRSMTGSRTSSGSSTASSAKSSELTTRSTTRKPVGWMTIIPNSSPETSRARSITKPARA